MIRRVFIASVFIAFLYAAHSTALSASAPLAPSPAEGLSASSARITIIGNSNVHPWSASTSTVRVTRAEVAPSQSEPDLWADVLKPGGVTSFEIAIPVASLTGTNRLFDEDLRKALDAEAHPDITFRLTGIEPVQTGVVKATGVLKVAGAEREMSFALNTQPRGNSLMINGSVDLLMTDFGIQPPTAMFGTLKTMPKVTISFDVLLIGQ